MKISRAHLADPSCNSLYAALAIAISVIVFAYSERFGPASILLLYMIWLPLLLVDDRILIARPFALLLPVLFCGFILASIGWSAAPSITMRSALQYSSGILCALIAARTVSLPSLARGFVCGTVFVAIYSLLFGHWGYDAIDGSYNFVGTFSSKNQLGLFCSLGVYFCVVSLLHIRFFSLETLATIAAGGLLLLTLFMSASATSIISLLGAILILMVSRMVLFVSATTRLFLFMVGFVALGAILFAAMNSELFEVVLGAFGKDATLTGRTYLWAEGIAAGNEKFWSGYGYGAYWVQGFADAERLWEEFYIGARAGFHFHNTYIQTYVELGIVGLGLLVLIFLATLVQFIVGLVIRADRTAVALLGLLIMMIVRSFAEVDVLYQYTVGSFLLVFLHVASHGRSPLDRRTGLRASRAAASVPLMERLATEEQRS